MLYILRYGILMQFIKTKRRKKLKIIKWCLGRQWNEKYENNGKLDTWDFIVIACCLGFIFITYYLFVFSGFSGTYGLLTGIGMLAFMRLAVNIQL